MNREQAIDQATGLRRCPFCGGRASFVIGSAKPPGHYVMCTNGDCNVGTAMRVTDAEAAQDWNRRPESPQDVAQSATIRCPRCRTEQEIIFHYATLGGGLGACTGPANRKRPCAECGSPPSDPCRRVAQNMVGPACVEVFCETPIACSAAGVCQWKLERAEGLK